VNVIRAPGTNTSTYAPGQRGPVCRVALPSVARSGGRALRVARQPVVRDLLPGRGVGNELPEFGPHPRVAIEGPQSHPRLGVVGGIAGENRRAALAAEPLLVPIGGFQAFSAASPLTMRNEPGTTVALADAAVPVRRWQRVQWQ